MRFFWKSSFSTRPMRMLALVEFLERDRRRAVTLVKGPINQMALRKSPAAPRSD